jgi:uncharacterized membrane protein YgcG
MAFLVIEIKKRSRSLEMMCKVTAPILVLIMTKISTNTIMTKITITTITIKVGVIVVLMAGHSGGSDSGGHGGGGFDGGGHGGG